MGHHFAIPGVLAGSCCSMSCAPMSALRGHCRRLVREAEPMSTEALVPASPLHRRQLAHLCLHQATFIRVRAHRAWFYYNKKRQEGKNCPCYSLLPLSRLASKKLATPSGGKHKNSFHILHHKSVEWGLWFLCLGRCLHAGPLEPAEPRCPKMFLPLLLLLGNSRTRFLRWGQLGGT